jgi:DNA-binding transcriptional LysR family regulator
MSDEPDYFRNPLGSLSEDVELRQLEYFLAIVEEGSFSSAASRLFMVQSSLSASLLGLERELGTDLFIRGRRGAELTDAGRALLEPARAALEQTGRARDAVAEVRGLLRGTVRIAYAATPRIDEMAETLSRFRKEHPEVQVHAIPADVREVADLVIGGQVDFAVTPRIDRAGSAFRFKPLVSSPLALICPAGHHLAGARDVDPGDVVDELIIDLPRGWQSRDLFDQVMNERGLTRQVTLEVQDCFGVLALVQRGMGISYGARACVDPDMFDGVGVATLAGAPLWELGVAYRDDTLRGAAGRAFLAAYLEQCSRGRTPAVGATPQGDSGAFSPAGPRPPERLPA